MSRRRLEKTETPSLKAFPRQEPCLPAAQKFVRVALQGSEGMFFLSDVCGPIVSDNVLVFRYPMGYTE